MAIKYIVLYSGGLDSRLVVKILKERYGARNIEAVYFKLGFSGKYDNENKIKNFLKKENIKLKIFDVTKGKLLCSYLSMLKHPKHGRGKGFNPCVDCKKWMLNHVKEYCKKYGRYGKDYVIATGEVKGQRPMSQTSHKLNLISRHIGFDVYRPLIEIGIEGRTRTKQMNMARRYNIRYPTPSGGCLLCERDLKERYRFLINNNLIDNKTINMINIGRHFSIPFNGRYIWFVVGKNKKENDMIEKFKCISSSKGKPAVYYHIKSIKNKELRNKIKQQALELQVAYSKHNKHNNFEKYKL